MSLPQRKHLRRLDGIFHADRPALFFITCCVRGRAPVLTNDETAGILKAGWQDAFSVHGWLIGRYVVMPDHVHFFTSPTDGATKDVSRFISDWKRWTKRQIRRSVMPDFDWQREFFDHLMRGKESYQAKWEYVRANPVRADLVSDAGEWPYQGEIHVLEWW